jgi:hypothetical protein
MYLLKDHAEFMATLARSVNPMIDGPLLNDPRFGDPSGGVDKEDL